MDAMAVRVDTDTVKAAAPRAAYRSGEHLLAAEAVSDLEAGYGGVNADVSDGTVTWQVWVGIVDRALTGECDCPAARGTSLCPHAVATALAALQTGVAWSAVPVPRADTPLLDPAERGFRALAQTLATGELIALISRHAMHDRLLATDLEVTTGRLGAPTAEDLAALRALADEARAIPDGRYEYALHDVATAARAVLAELRVQALRPPSLELLDAAEYVIGRWDHLAGVLRQDWRTYDDEISEIGSALAAVHLDLCEQLRLDPLDLAERLAALAAACDADSCLYPPTPYRHLLGPDGAAAFEQR
jgi:uncharacterized Zn finger protein